LNTFNLLPNVKFVKFIVLLTLISTVFRSGKTLIAQHEHERNTKFQS